MPITAGHNPKAASNTKSIHNIHLCKPTACENDISRSMWKGIDLKKKNLIEPELFRILKTLWEEKKKKHGHGAK